MCLLESRARLSESRLWQWQRRFYEERGPAAWSEGIVPWRATNSSALAETYCQLVEALLRDGLSRGWFDPGEPIYLLELGAGSGRLAYLLLRRLAELVSLPLLERVQLRYLLTDFADKNLHAFSSHPKLVPFLEKGLLELATFDAGAPLPPRRFPSGEPLERLANPPVVVANYFIDSLPADLYRASGGRLEAARVTLRSRQALEPDLTDPSIIERLEAPRFEYTSAESDAGCRLELLRRHAERLGEGHFFFPRAAQECFERLSQLSGGRWALLAADKGTFDLESLRGSGAPSFASHGSISVMVDFTLLAELWEERGATVLQGSRGSKPLGLLALMGEGGPWPETRRAFALANSFGPLDRHQLLEALLLDPGLSIERALSLARLSQFDPDVVMRLCAPLRERLSPAGSSLGPEIAQALLQTWANHYPMGEKNDLAFELATVFQRLGLLPAAAELYRQSLLHCGQSFAALFNWALCLADLEKLPQACAAMRQASALEPGHARAAELCGKWAARLPPQTPGG